jgi:hypothetical protein
MGSGTKALHAHVCTGRLGRLCHRQGTSVAFISFHLSQESHRFQSAKWRQSDMIAEGTFGSEALSRI